MEAKTLMIGDWISHESSIGEKKGRIMTLHVNRHIDGDDVAEVAYDNGEWQTFRDMAQIKPIPLTKEILEKNFEKKTFYGIYDDYFDLDIREWSDGIYIVTYHSCEMNIPDQTVNVCYLHELQHFLRLVGIEKEIEL